jgi:hypothetical protein
MLEEKGIKVVQTEVPSDKLKATQKDLVGAKVVGMMGALEDNPNHEKITAPIYVSRDGFVIDGHHRWAAITAYNAQHPENQIPMKVQVIDKDIKDAIPMCNQFAEDMGIAAKKADANKEDSTQSNVKTFKGESSGKEIKTVELEGGGFLFGTQHGDTKMADDIINQVKQRVPKERWKDIVFVGEGGATGDSGELEFHDEMEYSAPKFKEMGASIDTWDGDELDVHNDQSDLYKSQKEQTGLSQNKIKAGNWASMIGQGEGTDTMSPNDYLDDEGKQFLQDAAKEAGLPPIENWDNPTGESPSDENPEGSGDKGTLYRLSFPEDNGDTETGVNTIQVAFNKARDLNLIKKQKQLAASGKIPVVMAGESHADLVDNILKSKKSDSNNQTSTPKVDTNNNSPMVLQKIKDGVKNWSVEEKEFFKKKIHNGNSPERRTFSESFKDKAKGAWESIKHGAEHEVHTFKEAGTGVKNFFSGGKVSESEKKALIEVAKKVAIAAAFGAAGGGLAHGAAAFGKHLMVEFVPHVVAETVLMGAGKAALFAGDTDSDEDVMKFMEIISKKLESEDIPKEIMASAIESYNENKPKKEMKEENIDLANELMLEMVYGFISEILTETNFPPGPKGTFWVRNKVSKKVYLVKSPKEQVHEKPSPKQIEKAAGEAKEKLKASKAAARQQKPQTPAAPVGKKLGADDFRDNPKEKDIVKTPAKPTAPAIQLKYQNENAVTQMQSRDGKAQTRWMNGEETAPGTDAGAFNEVFGMTAAAIIRKNPNITDAQLEKLLRAKADKGSVTKDLKVSGGDKMTAAIQTGRAINQRTSEIAEEEGYDPKTLTQTGYWGSASSKASAIAQLAEMVKKNPKIRFNGLTFEEYKQIILTGGGGEDPTDTMIVMHDGKSNNVAILHVSNKIGSNNIQANSTVKFTYIRAINILDELQVPGKDKEQ